jgi:hypothetical protein
VARPRSERGRGQHRGPRGFRSSQATALLQRACRTSGAGRLTSARPRTAPSARSARFTASPLFLRGGHVGGVWRGPRPVRDRGLHRGRQGIRFTARPPFSQGAHAGRRGEAPDQCAAEVGAAGHTALSPQTALRPTLAPTTVRPSAVEEALPQARPVVGMGGGQPSQVGTHLGSTEKNEFGKDLFWTAARWWRGRRDSGPGPGAAEEGRGGDVELIGKVSSREHVLYRMHGSYTLTIYTHKHIHTSTHIHT